MENSEATPVPTATSVANPEPTPSPASTPALYNPNVASSLSVFFSPIFGGWCCRHNYLALGLPDKAKRSQLWMLLGVVYLALSLFVPGVGKGWLIFLVVWYYCDCRKQAQYLKENDVAYEKKNWRRPLSVAIGVTTGLLLCLLVLDWLFWGKPTT